MPGPTRKGSAAAETGDMSIREIEDLLSSGSEARGAVGIAMVRILHPPCLPPSMTTTSQRGERRVHPNTHWIAAPGTAPMLPYRLNS